MGGDTSAELDPQSDDGKELVQGIETRDADPIDLDHADVVENDAPVLDDGDDEDSLDSDSDLDDGGDEEEADED
jgi:hypothetical protein